MSAASTAYSHGNPSDWEQLQLELINAARAEPAGEAARLGINLNQGLAPDRISADFKPPLAFHPLLIQAARNHSDWMLAADVFSHTGSGGSSPQDRGKAAGYKFGVAENISYQSTSATPDFNRFTRSTHENLFKSPGHRTNLMEPSYSLVGLGLRQGVFQGMNALMVTQNFSEGGESVDSGPFLLGVVYEDKNANGRYDPGEGLPGVRVEPDLLGYHAVTSSSGGYAVPLPPVETLSEQVDLPFRVRGLSWESVRPHDESFRKRKIQSAARMPLKITWSGASIGGTSTSQTTIRRPVRINYRLMGTDRTFFPRSMVTAENVKFDFVRKHAPALLTQKIAFPALGRVKFGTAPLRPAAKASSGLAVAYVSSNASVARIENGKIRITGAGTAKITARQPGDAKWQAAPPISQNLTVAPGDQTIVFGNPGNRTFQRGHKFTLVATATSKLQVAFTSSNPGVVSLIGREATLRAKGKVTITATQPGDKNWNPAKAVQQTLTIK